MVGVEGVALGGSRVETDGYKTRALQHLDSTTTSGKVGIGIGGDEKFGEVTDNKNDVADVGLRGEEFEQAVADGTRDEECVALGEEFFTFGTKKKNRLDAEGMDIAVAVNYPKAIVDGRELEPKGVGDFGEVDKTEDKTGAGNKLLEIG